VSALSRRDSRSRRALSGWRRQKLPTSAGSKSNPVSTARVECRCTKAERKVLKAGSAVGDERCGRNRNAAATAAEIWSTVAFGRAEWTDSVMYSARRGAVSKRRSVTPRRCSQLVRRAHAYW
jgi:hypothetical protein